MMKTGFLNLLLCLSTTVAFSQAHIRGKVADHQQNLPLANVLLLGADSVLVKGVITNTEGEFIFENIPPGQYRITTSMVGYKKYTSEFIPVSNSQVTLPTIILEEIATELNEVTIKADKPLFEQQVDRLVINVHTQITSAGNTVLEVLQKSPGIVVNRQNNSVSMNGKSGVRVMINDKIQQLPLDVVVQMLDGMSASNVERIELITTPPAKYDAEGNAGIIHIVTKQNEDLGTNGNVGVTFGYRWAEVLGANVNLTHRNKKFAYFLDYSVMRTHNLHLMDMDRRSVHDGFTQTVTSHSHRENITTLQNLSAGVEWKLTDKTSLNFLVTGYRRNWELDAITQDVNHAAPDSTVNTQMKIYESNIWQSATAAIGLQTKITPKSSMDFNLDYLYYHNDNPSRYNNTALHEQGETVEESTINLSKNTPIRFLIPKIDYRYDPVSSLTLEAGLKAVISKLNNDVLVQRWEDNDWVTDPDFTSYSTLEEQIGAAYASVRWQPSKKVQITGGLRYEYTHTAISTPEKKDTINRKYGYFFPSFFLKREIGSEKDIQFSYTRRITRPTYNDIAPFVFFWSPNTFSAGNTTLWPSISDAITLGYHRKQWIISLQFTHAQREIIPLQPEESKDDQNSLIYRSQNLEYLNTLGLTTSVSFTLTRWWEVQTNLTTQYQVARTAHLSENETLNLYGLNLTVTNVLKLPRDFSMEVSGYYQSKSLFGASEFLPMGSLNAGIQKKFGEKGTLKLAMDDILYTSVWRIRTDIPQNNLYTYINYDWHNQFVRLTYTRNIGNHKLRSVKLTPGSEEERSRVTN